MFLKGIWFIIVGVFLLGYSPAQAEPYLRVHKKGVIYYHFTSREPARAGQTGGNAPRTRGEAWIQAGSRGSGLPSSSGKRPIPRGSQVAPKVYALAEGANLRPLIAEMPDNLAPIQSSESRAKIFPGTNSLLRWLTKLGCRSPLAASASASRQSGRRPGEVSAAQPTRIAAPEGWKKLLKQAYMQPAVPGFGQPGLHGFLDYGTHSYRFPVAGPYSFRDSWGDSRSGGRMHRAVDIAAPEGTEVYAITTGVIDCLATYPEAGITLLLRGQDGNRYGYMHLQGYAPGMVKGKVVQTGELIGYVGRTGMRTSAAHLHFQVCPDHLRGKDNLINPYPFLVQLCRGVGVTDLNQPKIARLGPPENRNGGIKVYRSPRSAASPGRVQQFSVRDSSVLVIKNF